MITIEKSKEAESKTTPAGQTNPTDKAGVLVFPPALCLGTLLLGLLLHFFVWPAHLATAPWPRIAGAVLVAVAISLSAWGVRTMLRTGTNVDPNKPALTIVTSGPFRYTRNPLYLALAIVYVGLTLIFNTVWPLSFLLPMIFMLHWGVILREERYLEAKFGEPYVAYKARVRRWI